MGDCLWCYRDAKKQCNICGLRYCSDECLAENQHCHEVTCYPTLPQRIKSATDFAVRCVRPGEDIVNLSKGYVRILTGGKLYHRINPFGVKQLAKCVFCAETINCLFSVEKIIMYPVNKKKYNSCQKCANKTLCPVTFMDTETCKMNHGTELYLVFLACLKLVSPNVPKDIKQLIAREFGLHSHTSDNLNIKKPGLP